MDFFQPQTGHIWLVANRQHLLHGTINFDDFDQGGVQHSPFTYRRHEAYSTHKTYMTRRTYIYWFTRAVISLVAGWKAENRPAATRNKELAAAVVLR